VVVYKVDRLTRSLADFAKLIELFEANDVSFVSVTQSFNTSSSMGRLTLNVLLSFAQFERELIGERVRDKIAASKRKGLWVGRPLPLGYSAVDKKVVVVPAEAEAVRTIFQRYLALGSIRGARRRPRISGASGVSGDDSRPAAALAAARLGSERWRICSRTASTSGKSCTRREVHRGDQAPILARDLFEAVQEKARGASRRAALPPARLTRRPDRSAV
jgi:site-specific DNA recombinase